jgi:hypothetical protein
MNSRPVGGRSSETYSRLIDTKSNKAVGRSNHGLALNPQVRIVCVSAEIPTSDPSGKKHTCCNYNSL